MPCVSSSSHATFCDFRGTVEDGSDDAAGRELTKAAIDDIITRGDVKAWRALVSCNVHDFSRLQATVLNPFK